MIFEHRTCSIFALCSCSRCCLKLKDWPLGCRLQHWKLPTFVLACRCSVPSRRTLRTQGALLAGSPLFLTDLDAPMYWTEIQFVLSGPINGLFERMFETEAGPLFLNGVFLLTLMRMGVYYGFMQPSYLWHFQDLQKLLRIFMLYSWLTVFLFYFPCRGKCIQKILRASHASKACRSELYQR
eukprot:Skav216721  [mRNA]  locus=scaffold91:786516:788752:- [translate_table: standard]